MSKDKHLFSMKKVFADFLKITQTQIISQGVNTNTLQYSFFEKDTLQKNAIKLIESCFSSLPTNSKIYSLLQKKAKPSKSTTSRILISSPTFSDNPQEMVIRLFYYSSSITTKNRFTPNQITSDIDKKQFTSAITVLSKSLSLLYCKKVSLCVTKIHYPYLNATIFAKYLGHNSSSNTFVHFQDAIITYPSLHMPSKLLANYNSGMKIQVSGRLSTQRIIPRVTRKTAFYGSFANAPVVDYGKYTMKNYIGVFTIKVWIAQRSQSSK